MARKTTQGSDGKLDTIIELLQNILALDLARGGVNQNKIAKHLGVATAKVNRMLHGIKRES